MTTMGAEIDERLDGAATRAEGGGGGKHSLREGATWGRIARGAAALLVARAAQRVLERQAEMPDMGRLGGTVYTPAAPAPAAAVSSTKPAKAESGKAESAGDAQECPQTHRQVIPLAKRVFKEFGADNGTLMAASVAYYFMLSLVPLIAVAVAIFGYVMGSKHAYDAVMSFVSQFFPAQKSMSDMLAGAIHAVQQKRGAIGIVGLATLLLTAMGGFATLETAINVTWAAKNRNFIMNKLFAFGMMLLISVLMFASLAVTGVLQWAGQVPGLFWLADSLLLKVVGYLLTVVISWVMFSCIYKFFPNARVNWRPALISGAITAVFWEVFKQGYFLMSRGDQSATYGTLAGFVGLVVWIYYTMILIMLGSELAWVLQGCPEPEAIGGQDEGAEGKKTHSITGRRAAAS